MRRAIFYYAFNMIFLSFVKARLMMTPTLLVVISNMSAISRYGMSDQYRNSITRLSRSVNLSSANNNSSCFSMRRKAASGVSSVFGSKNSSHVCSCRRHACLTYIRNSLSAIVNSHVENAARVSSYRLKLSYAFKNVCAVSYPFDVEFILSRANIKLYTLGCQYAQSPSNVSSVIVTPPAA